MRDRILLVENDVNLVEVVTYNLRREGFDVSAAAQGREGLRRAQREEVDLILLDRVLPDLDGLEVCRRLRRDPLTEDIPVIVIAARVDENDLVLSLGAGADDYVTRPLNPRELVARIRAVLRRVRTRADETAPERVSRGPLVVDEALHEVRLEDRVLKMTATEFRLLHFLAAHAGRVFTRKQLLRPVAGPHAKLVERNVDVHVRAIRRKLGEHAGMIETVRGVGYRLRTPQLGA